MTTVVAVARGGAVYMAADTRTNVYNRPIIGAVTKIKRLAVGADEALIGVCGSGALAGIVQYDDIECELASDENPDAWAHRIACAITALAVTAGIVADGCLDGTLILGWNGLLWTLTHAQAIRHPDGIAAIGSGEGPAIGAVDALLSYGVEPAAAVYAAVRVAIARDVHSAGPIQAEELASVPAALVGGEGHADLD